MMMMMMILTEIFSLYLVPDAQQYFQTT